MQEYDLDYDVQEVRLLNYAFKVTTVANEALPIEMLMQLQERRSGEMLGVQQANVPPRSGSQRRYFVAAVASDAEM